MSVSKKVSRRSARKVKKSKSKIVELKKVKNSTKVKNSSKKNNKRAKVAVTQLILDHRENGRKLARSILKKWRVRMSAEEVDSIVDLSLCEAAKRYSPDKGASFMTFFFYHLRGQLVRSITSATQENSIFLACAQSAGIDTSDWYRTEDGPSWDYVPDYLEQKNFEIENPEQSLIKKQEIKRCETARNSLDELEQEIIFRSFYKEEALVDIARDLGYSRCHISRVKKSALNRLKSVMKQGAPANEETRIVEHKSKNPLAHNKIVGRIRSFTTVGNRRSRRRKVKATISQINIA